MDFRQFFEEQEKVDESLLGLAKSGWNIAKGVANTGGGLMTVGDEALAKLVGQGTKGRMGMGARQLGRGLSQLFVGNPDEIRSAPTQPAKPQPAGKSDPKPAHKPAPETKPAPPETKPPETKPAPASAQKTGDEFGMPVASPRWKILRQKHREAKTIEEKKAIEMQMAMADPAMYAYSMRMARRRNNRRN